MAPTNPFGPFDERFVYQLTNGGKKAIEVRQRFNGEPTYIYIKGRCTLEIVEPLNYEAWREKSSISVESRSRNGEMRPGTVRSRCGMDAAYRRF